MKIKTGFEDWTMTERDLVIPSKPITGTVESQPTDAFGEPFMKALAPAGSYLLGKSVRHQGKAAKVRFMLDSDAYGHGAVVQYADHSWGWCEQADISDLEVI